MNEFSVWQFFSTGQDCIKREVSSQEAMETAADYIRRPSARIGIIKRLIVTDGGDFTCFEWRFGEGVTYPGADVSRKFKADEDGSQ